MDEKDLTLTKSEVNTALFYIEHALIEAKGDRAVGIGSNKSVANLESIKKKLLRKKMILAASELRDNLLAKEQGDSEKDIER